MARKGRRRKKSENSEWSGNEDDPNRSCVVVVSDDEPSHAMQAWLDSPPHYSPPVTSSSSSSSASDAENFDVPAKQKAAQKRRPKSKTSKQMKKSKPQISAETHAPQVAATPRIDDEISAKRSYGSAFRGVCLFGFFLCICFLQIKGEEYKSFTKRGRQSEESSDFYEVLGVSRIAESPEIRRAYRRLSLRWHPDKNLGCDECQDKFREISKAFEALADPVKRRAYDVARREAQDIPSNTPSLDALEFETGVMEGPQASAIWVIEVFSMLEPRCHEFANIWETVAAEKKEEGIRFARLSLDSERRDKLRMLPFKPRILPAVFMRVGETPPKIASLQSLGNRRAFKQWISSSLPTPFVHLRKEGGMLSPRRPGILLAGAKPAEVTNVAAARWQSVFQFAYAPGMPLSAGFHGFPAKAHTSGRPFFSLSVDESPEALDSSLRRMAQAFVVNLDAKNFEVLCGGVWCLVVKDEAEAATLQKDAEEDAAPLQMVKMDLNRFVPRIFRFFAFGLSPEFRRWKRNFGFDSPFAVDIKGRRLLFFPNDPIKRANLMEALRLDSTDDDDDLLSSFLEASLTGDGDECLGTDFRVCLPTPFHRTLGRLLISPPLLLLYGLAVFFIIPRIESRFGKSRAKESKPE